MGFFVVSRKVGERLLSDNVSMCINQSMWSALWQVIVFGAVTVCPGKVLGDESFLGAMTLSQAEKRALVANTDILSSRLLIKSAEADVVVASELANPQLSIGTTGANLKQGIGSAWQWNKSVDSVMRLDQQIERGNKRGIRVNVAKKGVMAAELDASDMLRTVKQQVDLAYYNLKYAQEMVGSYNRLLLLQTNLLDAARLQYQYGGASEIDVTRIKTEVGRARSDVARAELTMRNAQIGLAKLLGDAGDSTRLVAVDDWPYPVKVDTAQIEKRLDERPDVIAAHARLEQAQLSIELARAQRTRDVGVGLQYEHNMTGTTAPNAWSIGVSVPLFLLSKYEGEIQRAVADRNVAEESLKHIKTSAEAELQQAMAEVNNSLIRLNNYKSDVLDQARTAAEAAEYAYHRGALNLTDLLDARRAWQSLIIDMLDAQNDYAGALADWRAATASNSEAPVQ